MTGDEFLALEMQIANDLIKGIRENRKEILGLITNASDKKIVGDIITSLNRSSTFRNISEGFDVGMNLIDAKEYIELSYKLQNGELDSEELANAIYEKVADKILDKFSKAFPIFKIPKVRTEMKKGGKVLGNWGGEKADQIVYKLMTGSKFEKWVKQKAKDNPDLVDLLRKLSGKPPLNRNLPNSQTTQVVEYNPNVTSIDKHRKEVEATLERYLKEKQNKMSCKVDDLMSTVDAISAK